MKGQGEEINNWLKSNEVKKELKMSDCDLAHLRQAGFLGFTKQGNAFLYNSNDVNKIKGNVKRS
jgi:hypothetical protein